MLSVAEPGGLAYDQTIGLGGVVKTGKSPRSRPPSSSITCEDIERQLPIGTKVLFPISVYYAASTIKWKLNKKDEVALIPSSSIIAILKASSPQPVEGSGRVFISRDVQDEKVGRIIIPGTTKGQTQEGVVSFIDPRIKVNFEPGDRVMFEKDVYSCPEFRMGRHYMISVHHKKILAKL